LIAVSIMSSGAVDAEEAEAAVEAEKEAEVCCANCGIAQVDDIKLKICDGCDLVKYCSDKCRENHKEQHEDECKKRKAELHDKELFEQPEKTCYGECPICFLPLPIDTRKCSLSSCCCELICNGCVYADRISSGHNRCPFCREPAVDCKEENEKRVMERVKVNDPNALRQMGVRCGKEGDYDGAFEYLKEAAESGDAAAHYILGDMYYNGDGVEENEEEAVYHWEKAAVGGHPIARYNLAHHEEKNGNVERAVRHLIIAAKLGYEKSMQVLWKYYSGGDITKEELDATLRTHKAAIDATKSSQRDVAEGRLFYNK
jgi:tetratricopeptide (TPR) repeat protein